MGQELSTLGKKFWLTFMESIGTPNNPNELKIVISGKKNATGTIKNFNTSVTYNFTLTGGGVTTVLINESDGYVSGSESASSRNKGLYIESSDTVAVSAQSTKPYSCDAALIYPIEALSTEYRVVSQMGDPSTGFGSNANYRSEFCIVATENNTSIEITPTAQTSGGNSAGTAFTITLNKGETYQVKANTNKLDLSGSLIKAADCKKIAVFGGSNRSFINYGSCNASADNLYEQMMPTELWGKRYIVIPTIFQANRTRKAELIKVVANVSSTRVFFNGRSKVLPNPGSWDTFWLNSSQYKAGLLTSVKNFAVCQFAISEDCDKITGGTDTDPMMMWIPPVELSLPSLTFSCENAQTINKFFINIICLTKYTNLTKIDGLTPTATFQKVPNDTNYSFIQQAGLAQGTHTLVNPFGFSATLYAYGDRGSYGYSAGSSIKPLSISMKVAGKLSTDLQTDTPYFEVCKGTNILFEGTSDLVPNSWRWEFSDNVTRTTKNTTRAFNDTGLFTIKMITIRNANGTCNGSSTINDTNLQKVKVYDIPYVKLMNDTVICKGNSFPIKSKTNSDSVYVFGNNSWLSCTNCFEPIATPLKDTFFAVSNTYRACVTIRDTMKVTIRDSLFLFKSNDTTICRGTSANLSAWATGGFAPGHEFRWSHGLGIGANKTVSPNSTTTYQVILSDYCTLNDSLDFYEDTLYVKVTVHDSLKITMPKDTTFCEGNSVDLTVSIAGGNGNAFVTWDNGLGAGLTKTVTPSSTTIYKAVLSDGCTVPKDSGIVTVTIRPSMKIDTIIFPTPVCKNVPFNITAKGKGGDSTGYRFYLYDITSGSMLQDSGKAKTTVLLTSQIKDDSRFRVSMSQKCNSQVTSKTFNIKIKDHMTVTTINPFDTVCYGEIFNLVTNGTSADNLPIKFVLKEKTGVTTYAGRDSAIHASQKIFVINRNNPKTEYMITVDDGCSRPDSTYFIFNVRPQLTMTKPSNDLICNGDIFNASVTLSGGRPNTYQYVWKNKYTATDVSYTNNISLIPTTNSAYTINVTDGCSAPLNDSCYVQISPVVTNNNICDDLSSCQPLSTTFFFPLTQAIPYRNTPFNWKYYFDGNLFSDVPSFGGQTHPNIPRTYTASGVFTGRADMVLSNGKICFTTSENVESYQNAEADFDYNPKKIDIVDPQVTFLNHSIGSNIYTWNFGDGSPLDNSTNPIYSYKDTGLFTIMLIANNDNNCSDTTYQDIRVLDIFRIHIPTAFSPNGDRYNNSWKPVITSYQSAEIEIFNRWGQRIYQSNDIKMEWDGNYANSDEHCMEGIYYYRIKVRDNRKKWHYYTGTITLLR